VVVIAIGFPALLFDYDYDNDHDNEKIEKHNLFKEKKT